MNSPSFIRVILFVSALIAIVCFGCKPEFQRKKDSPAKVSARFFKLLKDQRYAEAKELGTEKTRRVISAVELLSEMGGGINILRDNKKELLGCVTRNDTTICTYKAFSGPDEKVVLIRQKGRWLVDLMNPNGP
jgi:hypothetical protein